MKSIMFGAPMIRALLAGRKTQTRRVLELPLHIADAGATPLHKRTLLAGGTETGIEAPRECWVDPGGTDVFGPGPYLHVPYEKEGDQIVERVRCWYGYPPDQLWVKESWRPGNSGGGIEYRADFDDPPKRRTKYGEMAWGSPRFMAKSYSRLTLTLTRVRIEKLQGITEEDARTEGVAPADDGDGPCRSCGLGGDHQCDPEGSYRLGYRALWDSINGKRGLSWAMNPIVVVLEFTVQQHEAQSLINARTAP